MLRGGRRLTSHHRPPLYIKGRNMILERYTPDFIATNCAFIGFSLVAVAVAVGLDMWSGVECARKRGVKVKSDGLRRTISKMGDYWRVQGFGIVTDILLSIYLDYPVATIVITLGEILIEFKSVLENYRRAGLPAGKVDEAAGSLLRSLTERDIERLKDYLRDNGKGGGEKGVN